MILLYMDGHQLVFRAGHNLPPETWYLSVQVGSLTATFAYGHQMAGESLYIGYITYELNTMLGSYRYTMTLYSISHCFCILRSLHHHRLVTMLLSIAHTVLAPGLDPNLKTKLRMKVDCVFIYAYRKYNPWSEMAVSGYSPAIDTPLIGVS